MEALEITDLPTIWGNLRNLIDFSSISIPAEISLVGTTLGKFPVDNLHPIYLEVSRNLKKVDISGRLSVPVRDRDINWSWKRVISLPRYENNNDIGTDCLKKFFEAWKGTLIPEEIPSLALAIKIIGQYSETREGQYVVVLLVWPSYVARILELDWFEGPLEDCITPEWYISTSELMKPSKAFEKMRALCSRTPFWQNPCYIMYSIPECLIESLNGEKREYDRKDWKFEHIYRNHDLLLVDLGSVLEKIENLLA